VRVLAELALVEFERAAPALAVAPRPGRTALERSAAFVAYQRELEDGRRFLTSSDTTKMAA
jgi:single-stranded-DNA-specific exonuclease